MGSSSGILQTDVDSALAQGLGPGGEVAVARKVFWTLCEREALFFNQWMRNYCVTALGCMRIVHAVSAYDLGI